MFYISFYQGSPQVVLREISVPELVFLIPHGEPALSVAWTLVFEMFFYTIFSIWFISRKLTTGFFYSGLPPALTLAFIGGN